MQEKVILNPFRKRNKFRVEAIIRFSYIGISAAALLIRSEPQFFWWYCADLLREKQIGVGELA